MLQYELNKADDILIIKPKGSLESAALRRIIKSTD